MSWNHIIEILKVQDKTWLIENNVNKLAMQHNFNAKRLCCQFCFCFWDWYYHEQGNLAPSFAFGISWNYKSWMTKDNFHDLSCYYSYDRSVAIKNQVETPREVCKTIWTVWTDNIKDYLHVYITCDMYAHVTVHLNYYSYTCVIYAWKYICTYKWCGMYCFTHFLPLTFRPNNQTSLITNLSTFPPFISKIKQK